MEPSSPKTSFFVFILGLCLLVPVVHAQPAPPIAANSDEDSCTRDPECDRHYTQARTLSKVGKLAEAIKEYEAAYAIQPVPTLFYNLARLHHKLGHLEDAKRHYERYLQASLPSDVELRHKAEDYLKQLATVSLSRPLEPPAPQVSVTQPASPAANPQPAAQAPSPQPTPAALTPAAPPEKSPDTTAAKAPIYKKWWLWTLVGAAAVGVTAAVAGGVVASQNGPPKSSLGNARVFAITISR